MSIFAIWRRSCPRRRFGKVPRPRTTIHASQAHVEEFPYCTENSDNTVVQKQQMELQHSPAACSASDTCPTLPELEGSEKGDSQTTLSFIRYEAYPAVAQIWA